MERINTRNELIEALKDVRAVEVEARNSYEEDVATFKNFEIKETIKKIKLDAKTAVLAVCKTAAVGGSSGVGCGPPTFQPCQDMGS